MYWQQRPNSTNWIDQIRYFTDFDNELTADELRDAFINLARLFVTEYSNERLLEDIVIEELGEHVIRDMFSNTETGRELVALDLNKEDLRDVLGPTLKLCDYIEEKWFS